MGCFALGLSCLGLSGFLGVDLIGNIFGGTYQVISRMIYFMVGLAGVYVMPILMSYNDK